MAKTSHDLGCWTCAWVTFCSTQTFADGATPIQYGLVAEESAEDLPGGGGVAGGGWVLR
jgi:hypothetical protein